MGFMFEGLAVGTAAAALSLATNFTATVLTAYQAWYVRTPSLLNIGAWSFWDSMAIGGGAHQTHGAVLLQALPEERAGLRRERVDEQPRATHPRAPRRVRRALLRALGTFLRARPTAFSFFARSSRSAFCWFGR